MREFFVILNNQLGAYWNRPEFDFGFGGEHYENNIHQVCEHCRYTSYPDAMKMVEEIVKDASTHDYYTIYLRIERFTTNK